MDAPYVYSGEELDVFALATRWKAYWSERIRSYIGQQVLEVGAGTGSIAECYLDRVESALLVEVAHNLCETLRARFGARRGVSVHEGTIESVSAAPESFDAAVLVNVLEHIPDDAGALGALHRLVRPGGALLVFVPALQAIYGTLDARVGHVRRYERRALESLVRASGFEVETLRWFDVVGVAPWFVAGRVVRQRDFSRAQGLIYDRLVVPWLSRVESRIEPPFGKNLLCVARRR